MAKKYVVERYQHDKDWTLSHFYAPDGKLLCFGIEDEFRAVKVKSETRIPDGVYELGHRVSPKFSSSFYVNDAYRLLSPQSKASNPNFYKGFAKYHELIWVKNVPGFEFVLIHWGNTDDDTDGCYIVGDTVSILGGQKAVLNSKNTYMNIYPQIMRDIMSGEKVEIEYRSVNFNPLAA